MCGGHRGFSVKKPVYLSTFQEYTIKPRRKMDSSTAVSLEPVMDSSLVETREKAPLNQVLSLKASSMQRVIQMMRKNCITVLRYMCLPLGSPMCDKVGCCSARPQLEEEALQGLRSTVLIVNISNSTLTHCVIGNNTYQSTVADRQPLMQQPEHFVHGQRTCSCSHGQQGAEQASSTCPPPPPPPPSSEAEQQSVSIQSSQLSYVMIGDNNYMYAEQSEPFE